MTIAIVPFVEEHEPAVAAFNGRMRSASAASAFLLPQRAKPPVRTGAVTVTHYVAVDDTGAVRGGVMCMEHPAQLGDGVAAVVNIQSPLSEGIIDPAFTLVGPQLIKHVTRQNPHVFVVGMGAAANPLPRLLKAMGWALHAVPFYFRILRPSRCAQNLAPLRSTAVRRVGATVAGISGVAALAARAVHRTAASVSRIAGQFDVEPVRSWSSDADAIWDAFRRDVGFSVVRTSQTLPFFYPFLEGTPKAWWIVRKGQIEGWFGLLVTPMSNNAYFGNLVVATLTDVVGTPEAVEAAAVLATACARTAGAEIVITNQQPRRLQDACVAAGWRGGPSNFLVATSRALERHFDPATAYVTRRDGDGLTNLSSTRAAAHETTAR